MQELKDLSTKTELLKECAKEKLSVIGACNYCVPSETDDMTIYGAEVREASDMPATAVALMAMKDDEPIAYMNVDLTAE